MQPASDNDVGQLTESDLPALARGCAILGTGGGGSVETAIPSALQALRDHGPVRIVRLAELDDDALVVPMASIGAPTVGHEMLASVDQPKRLRDEIERLAGRPISAIMAGEIGGSNGVEPVGWAAELGVPLLDADGMGRAFPELQMVSMHVAGLSADVVVMADVVGNVAVLRPIDAVWSERQARAVCVASGASSMMANYLMTASQARGAVIEGSICAALAIGRSIAESTGDPVAGLAGRLDARRLVDGKIVEVERHTGGGFVRGSVVVDGTGADAGRMVRIEIQNENLVVFESGEVRASVPDLITVVDTQTADAISTEMLRYGQRVSVLAWPCDPLWRTERGLAVVGPRAFGYNLDYRPIEELVHAGI
ncbi:DUF917 domain-containing protein [Nonomuraea turcica]|uniref:DUF917 domain-containing protein n=1 Tax=Nonomuraea sp. G32 TaxID=3067274 RepID=UPI00273B0F83|nr:DUF917 domain-containing protein [Nonomuraea sp. G32]MDP4501315.1 DUF917 domain-containing protein [Nonomuraea sp. G32]